MKTALITGTGCDIGREVALFLGAKNYKILTHGTEMKETLKNTHQALEDRNISYSTYLADFSLTDEVVSQKFKEITNNQNDIIPYPLKLIDYYDLENKLKNELDNIEDFFSFNFLKLSLVASRFLS